MPLVYKFGGASIKDAKSIKMLEQIIPKSKLKIVIVVSAMDKTTRHLESLIKNYLLHKNVDNQIKEIVKYHHEIINELFGNKAGIIKNGFNRIAFNLFSKLNSIEEEKADLLYDYIIAYGELFSSFIIHKYLEYISIRNELIDIRKVIKTDSSYKNAQVDWETTQELAKKTFKFENCSIYVTQGFIASDADNNTTSLGFEGSDFTASILAYSLNAEKLVLWKDVDGIYTSDPKEFDDVICLKALSYHEAVELAYFGAKVIHPKAIKPLQNKKIPLYIKSFYKPNEEGTVITETTDNQLGVEPYAPVFITKKQQILVSISPRDFSFISESSLEEIFSVLANNKIKVNLMQNSAISFSVCIDYNSSKILNTIKELRTKYTVLYNEDVTLLTIRHYNEAIISQMTGNKKVYIQQKSRHTARFVLS